MRSAQEYTVRPTACRIRRLLTIAAFTCLFAVPAVAQFRYPPYPYGAGYAGSEASLRVNVKPKEASVYVDGYFAGRVDDFDGTFQRLHLEPGQHEIVVYLEGHRSIHERLYFSPNQTRKISGTLERLAAGEPNEAPPVPAENVDRPERPNPGRMRPPVAGPPARRGPPPPDRGPGPGPGPGPGAGPDGQNRPNQPNQPAPSPVGTLSIRVQPGDADVIIDGERWTSGSSDERLLVQLSDGRHVIEVSKNGYRRFTTEIQLRAGETAPLNISLTPDR
jgi:hypothetical protein